ncbi:acyl transferase/acyl hydrolase/lysophospholipase [Elsinoe ampelina]|uniref:Patatin-like phospholipase domain-containing protein n=1 Tax=Elsinoe ampelina TaxID=302913 RepID=A0A6A6GD44_9PEZI|nr:acyl transferase/acyl hydrolase/lysophospholipase [Elsinoe ampelina]
MDMLHDVFALPGTLGRGITTGHSRSDSVTTDATATTVSQAPAGLFSPLRRLLRTSRDPVEDAAIHADPETPPNPTNERPENIGYRIQVLRVKLDQAQGYSEWLSAATELDALEGHDGWKLEEECSEYDVDLVKARLNEMDDIRISRDQKKIMMLVRTGLTRNLGNMGSLRLYKHSRVGTKALIERYIESVLDTVDALTDITKNGTGPLEPSIVLQELLLARQAFGRSALLLSGGGTFGMNHIGVIKCLFEANLLPRIISGASAGSIVSSVMCTKTDDEIPNVLKEFCYGNLQVFEKAGQETSLVGKAFRFLTKGSLFDIGNLVSVMKELLGDMTFQEAYNKTRRILNICVSTASLYELPRLLNYVTAPNVLIWSAVAASCSVPFVFSPGQLLAKDPRTGEEVPWNQSRQQWIDGSVENDIPMQRLSEMFNVNHFIVSQVNPHVVPFLEKDEKDMAKEARREETSHTTRSTWTQTLTTVARDEAMHRLQVLQEFGVLPNVLSKIRSVVGQRYAGDITIFPKISYAEFPYVLSNPDTAFMVAATLSGEKATWPKLSEIRNHCAIELAIDDAVHQLMTCVAFGPEQLDQHTLMTLGYPLTMSAQKYRQNNRRPHYRTLRTSLDLPRLSLRAPPRAPRDIHFSIGPSKGSLSATKDSQKLPGYEDLHSFSDSDATDSSDEINDRWHLSDDESSSDSEERSPPSPPATLWPSAVLFPWASQPATPSAHARAFAFTPMIKPDTPIQGMLEGTQGGRPSSPELKYKRLFHGAIKQEQQPVKSLRRRSKSVVDFDLSGTRGMMRRRKQSVSVGLRMEMGRGAADD